jgi:hypothetical protein
VSDEGLWVRLLQDFFNDIRRIADALARIADRIEKRPL